MPTDHSLEYRPQYEYIPHCHRKAPTGLVTVTCTCGLNMRPAPTKEAWRTFEEHRVLAGLPHRFPREMRLLFGLPG